MVQLGSDNNKPYINSEQFFLYSNILYTIVLMNYHANKWYSVGVLGNEYLCNLLNFKTYKYNFNRVLFLEDKLTVSCQFVRLTVRDNPAKCGSSIDWRCQITMPKFYLHIQHGLSDRNAVMFTRLLAFLYGLSIGIVPSNATCL